MKKILIIASDKSELKGFDDSFLTAVSGVGPVRAAAMAALTGARESVDALVSVGSCGAVSERLRKGDVVSFSSVVCPDQDMREMHLGLGVTIDEMRGTVGAISSNDRLSQYVLSSSASFSSSVTEDLIMLHADAADMEAYGVAVAATMLGIPFYAVKIVTDKVGEKSTIGEISHIVRENKGKLVEKVKELVGM